MKTVVVIGIGKENYNYKKIEGFINGFTLLKYEVYHYRFLNQEILSKHKSIDILFSESDYLEGTFNNVKNVILWTNAKLTEVVNFAKRNSNINIIFSPKSFMLDEEINEKYYEKFSTYDYQMVGFEGQSLDMISDIIKTKKKLDDFSYVLLDNLIFSFTPCAKSESVDPESIKDSKYRISYFGTGYNRPKIMQIYNFLQEKVPNQIKIYFVENGGPINPETCISFYKESDYVLHEQVNPVILEYAVRVGEASAAGAKVILFEDLPLYEKVFSLKKIPEMIKVNSVEYFLNNLDKFPKRNLEERKEQSLKFTHTYNNAIKEFEELFLTFPTKD
jgi:hypothetical protein